MNINYIYFDSTYLINIIYYVLKFHLASKVFSRYKTQFYIDLTFHRLILSYWLKILFIQSILILFSHLQVSLGFLHLLIHQTTFSLSFLKEKISKQTIKKAKIPNKQKCTQKHTSNIWSPFCVFLLFLVMGLPYLVSLGKKTNFLV